MWLILSSLWRRPLGVLDDSILSFLVLPNDIDVTKLTDDRYAAIMDLGRLDLALRTGLAGAMIRRKWAPLASFATIRFRYPLRAFQRYALRTRIIYWDDGAFCFRQTFERNGRTLATGYVNATLLGPTGPVSPDEILAAGRGPVARPDKPEIVSRLQELDALIHAGQRQVRAPDRRTADNAASHRGSVAGTGHDRSRG
ncbi:thioesterase family protein [Cognatiluteimonas weifangensis]|uniref:thioesterase family protein n=1 Tax=Cognatiluteimonas weifangensis TaxID=2303539 RepID=UPI00360C5233